MSDGSGPVSRNIPPRRDYSRGQAKKFHQLWLRQSGPEGSVGEVGPIGDYCLSVVAAKLALWRKARSIRQQDDLFSEDSWYAVLLGQRIVPQSFDPLVHALPIGEAGRFMHHLRDVVGKTAAAMPLHGAYIAQHCAA